MGELDAGHLIEELAVEVGEGAVARSGKIQLARRGLGGGNQALQVVGGGVGGDHQQHRVFCQQHHGGQVLGEVELQVGRDALVDDVGRGAQQQGVAVRRGAGHRLGRHTAACAGAVLHHHRLAQAL